MPLDEGDACLRSGRRSLDEPSAVADGVRQGDVGAIARLISLAEREDPRAPDALRRLRPRSGGAHLVGITGVPGGGKSTLVDQLIRVVRAQGLSVGVLAVDPSSPVTRGAILADRLRMQRRSADDPGTFIRSLSSRGDMGGLSAAVWDATSILDASGKDVIFIETVGAGQLETDIVSSAYSVVVVAVPGLGDSIQTMKAGLIEIADVFVVNMADRPRVSQAVRHLEGLHLRSEETPPWVVPVLTTVATSGEGVEALWETVRRHRTHLQETGAMAERLRNRARAELVKRLETRWRHRLRERLQGQGSIERITEEVVSGTLSVHDASALLWNEVDPRER